MQTLAQREVALQMQHLAPTLKRLHVIQNQGSPGLHGALPSLPEHHVLQQTCCHGCTSASEVVLNYIILRLLLTSACRLSLRDQESCACCSEALTSPGSLPVPQPHLAPGRHRTLQRQPARLWCHSLGSQCNQVFGPFHACSWH